MKTPEKIVMVPLEKVTLDGKDIALGMERAQVEVLLGAGTVSGSRSFYFDSELRIDYDENGRVEFVEFLGGACGKLKPEIFGVSAFDAEVNQLYKLLAGENGGDIEDEENGYSYAFRRLGVGVYREMKPEDVSDCVRAMLSQSLSAEGDPEIARMQEEASHWCTIGMGGAEYYRP